MPIEIIKINSADPIPAFSLCKEIITAGGVVVYPTDTFYGLGADPRNPDAVRKLFRIKGRSAGHPILLLIKDAAEVGQWCAGVTPLAERLMKQFWPGPLTLVFEAGVRVLPELTAGTGTIGLRVPGGKLTLQLLEFLGFPLTGTSANISGAPSPRSAQEAAEALGPLVDLVLDGGESAESRPSTVVNVMTGQVIREGALELRSSECGIRNKK